jgi:toxin-antitoxin system PIN domain toxin
VIAVDANVLVYAHRADAPWHREAARALAGLAKGTAPWAVPWPCVHEFLAIVTRPGIFRTPTPPETAFRALDGLYRAPGLALLSEAPDHGERLRDLVLRGRVRGAAVHDARVAAICLSHGVSELWTADRDFSRFPDLRVRNPLAG